MAFVCPTKSDTENKIKTANKIKEMLKDIEKDLNPGVNPVCVPFCVPLCNVPFSNPPEESKTKIDQNPKESKFCFPCCVPCGPYGEQVSEPKKEHGRKKHKKEPSEEKVNCPPPPNCPPPNCLPFCIPMCPPCCPQSRKEEEKERVFDPPQVMVCYREKVKECKPHKHAGDVEEVVHRLHQSKSRELRASILYTGCYCERRNGLQDDCPRTGCHGSPECLTKPPTCGPSEFCDGKHLGKKLNGRNGKQNGGDHSSGGSANGSNNNVRAKYKCFPASIKNPVLCCSPCLSDV